MIIIYKMSKQYICEHCNKEFIQKVDYTRHINKKNACISLDKIKENKNIDNEQQELKKIFDKILNILRDAEGITGEKALRNLSYLLILKLIEPHIGKTINFNNYEYTNSNVNINDLIKYCNFSYLVEIISKSKEESNILEKLNNLELLHELVLSECPITNKIFLKNKNFNIKKAKTFEKVINVLNSFDFTKCSYDILGHSYEQVIKDIMVGSQLGQFFTLPSVKNLMIDIMKPKLFDDGKIESLCDPTMGTGGFLITYLNYIIKTSETKKIKLDWNNINNNIYGIDIEPDTFQLAMSNMLISTGHMFDNLHNKDSIREPIFKKFDNILANPPYGIKGLKYDEFNYGNKNEYLPIKSDNAVSLFIQAIIYMLNINGKCCIVLPDGQDLFSKNNKTLITVREYLLKTCDLKEIYYLPSGIFTYTSIKTCVFYFVKKRECSEVLKLDIKYNKSNLNKEKSRDYLFCKTHQTKSIKFYDTKLNLNNDKLETNLLIDVPIEKLINNCYSLNYNEYLSDEDDDTDEENNNDNYDTNIITKTLGEICDINYGTRIVKSDNIEGDYPVYGSGRPMFTTNTFNRENFNILIGRFALSDECVRLVNEKLFLNDSGLTVKPKLENILHKYIGYYLLNIQDEIYKCSRGSAQKNLDINKFKSIKIPIPSLEVQKDIVDYLDYIYNKSIKTSNNKITELKELNKYCMDNNKKFGNNQIKTLEEVCDINYGTRIVKSDNIEGDYPVYGSGRPMFTTNTFNRENFNILIGRFALSDECVRLVNEKLFLNDSGLTVKPKLENILHKYIGYYLLNIQDEIYKCSRGSAQKNLDINKFKSIKIHIPSLEEQNKIIEYCENNNKLIKLLETEIETNKLLGKQFLEKVLKSNNI